MTTYSEQFETADLPWWLVLIEGISLAILGLLLVLKPGMTSVVVVQFMGLYWFIGGIFKIVSLLVDRELWGWKLFAGILGILAGIAVIQHPLWSTAIIGNTLIILLGFQGIFFGLVGLFGSFKGAGWAAAILGAVSVLFGILLLFNVWAATLSLPWVIGVLALIGGFTTIVTAFRLR
jgi:uncharacterized membrane protein HdeD (DUF308 family)